MVFRGAFRRTVAALFRTGFQNKTAKTFRKFQFCPMNEVSQDIGYRRPKKSPKGSAMNQAQQRTSFSNEAGSAINQVQR
jgi:hypothetical protein